MDAETVQQKIPKVLGRQLDAVQSTVRVIQQGLQLTDEQLPAFFKRHTISLTCSSDRAAGTLRAVSELLAMPVASVEMQEVVMVCGHHLFHHDPAVLHHLVSFFCKEFKGGQRAAKAALKQSIYQVSVDAMRTHASQLRTLLGLTEEELNHMLCHQPRMLARNPSTVASNMQKLQAHGFTSAQALKIYASTPALAGYDWSSPLNVEKLAYLMLILQLSPAEIASRPQLLGASLEHKLGPRIEIIYQSRAVSPDMPLACIGSSALIMNVSDAAFAATLNNISISPPLIYNEVFKRHWKHRWTFLRYEMGLSVADISACRALLITSLPNTLAPRWHFLTQLEAAQAGFRAADHLTALATLSDEHFALVFSAKDAGLVSSKDSMV